MGSLYGNRMLFKANAIFLSQIKMCLSKSGFLTNLY